MTEEIIALGDTVEVVIYGHLISWSKREWKELLEAKDTFVTRQEPPNIIDQDEDFWHCDISPELVGQQGVVSRTSTSGSTRRYALNGIKGKTAWYDDKQLKLISKKPPQ